MKIKIAVLVVGLFLSSPAAYAQYYYSSPDSYYAADRSAEITAVLSAQRNTEAIVNEMRAQRGLPPCSIGLLGQLLKGRPAC